MNRLIAGMIVLGGCLLSLNVHSESFEAYMKAQNDAFNAWKSEQDRAFYQFLKKGWKNYQIDPAEEIKRPKPEIIPIAKPQVIPKTKPVVVKPTVIESPQSLPKVIEKPKPSWQKPTEPTIPAKPTGAPLKFYGRTLYWPLDSSWNKVEQFQVGKVSKERVAEFWKTFAQANTSAVIKRFDFYSQRLNLNGWGRLQLAYQLSGKLMHSQAEQKLLTWALMVKMNEAVRLGYNVQDVYVLYESRQPLFNVNFWKYDGKKYYVFEPDGASIMVNRLFSYKGDFSKRPQALDLNYRQNPDLYIETTKQIIRFDYQGKSYRFTLPVSKDYVDYLYSLPLQASAVYFGRMPSKPLRDALIPQVKSAIKGMSQEESVNFLLALVQKGLKYKLDKEHFNRTEKYLMPEETLFYVYSDCEDHSFLFTWLVRETLGISVVGLDYPGHIATAVNLHNPTGKIYLYDNKKYVVADPTYINAPYGLEMPQFKNARVKLVPVN